MKLISLILLVEIISFSSYSQFISLDSAINDNNYYIENGRKTVSPSWMYGTKINKSTLFNSADKQSILYTLDIKYLDSGTGLNLIGGYKGTNRLELWILKPEPMYDKFGRFNP
ncbi:MAG: hypothetical protein JKY42_10580 [Flavobacteriales bacterium]|nr:hypothetical protein [Flavobacteriales bacterium]